VIRHLSFLVLCACGPVAQTQVEFPLRVAGQAGTFFTGEWSVTLDRADVAFGPLYLCAARTPSPELCATALGEMTDRVRVDALAVMPMNVGLVRAFTGAARSATFDYGVTWPTTEGQPQPALALAHSAEFSGVAARAGRSFSFTLALDVIPNVRGSHSVLLSRVNGEIAKDTIGLLARFDPARWWASVDFDALDAASMGAERIDIDPASDAGAAVYIQMTSNAPPALTFETP
jgi:hypothetical protein